jgi:hypothetical protein
MEITLDKLWVVGIVVERCKSGGGKACDSTVE